MLQPTIRLVNSNLKLWASILLEKLQNPHIDSDNEQQPEQCPGHVDTCLEVNTVFARSAIPDHEFDNTQSFFSVPCGTTAETASKTLRNPNAFANIRCLTAVRKTAGLTSHDDVCLIGTRRSCYTLCNAAALPRNFKTLIPQPEKLNLKLETQALI